MARTLVIKRVHLAGRSFEFNEKLGLSNGPYNAVINFYRSDLHSQNKFGKEDTGYTGSFGFDRFYEPVMAEGLIGEYKTLAGVQTKKGPIKNNHNYLCSYLSIWPPGIDGNTDSSKSTVDLYVKAAPNNAKKDKTAVKTEQVFFESSDVSCIKVGGAVSQKLNLSIDGATQKITITCHKPFSKEITITAKAQGKIIGQLIIYPNAKRYKTIIQPVLLKFEANEGALSKQTNAKFLTKLIASFNENAFNQAYIYAELAPQTDVITLAKSQFFNPKMLSKKADGNVYLKKNSEDDPDTSVYNDLVENRYAALLANQGKQNKAQEKLKEKENALLLVFDKHYSFTRTGLKYTKAQHTKKISTTAWNHPDVVKAKTDYDAALKAYNVYGSATVLNKQHKLHLFFSHQIHAAKNPENKVYAYSNTGNGVVHVFDVALKSTVADPTKTILHEIGHSLSLSHTFNLGEYKAREPGKIYKEDLEEEIKDLEEQKGKTVYKRKEILKQKKSGTRNQNIDNLTKLEDYYRRLEKYINKKNIKAFLEAKDRTKAMEANLSAYNTSKTTSTSTLDWEIKVLENKIKKLEQQKKTANKKLIKLSKSKAQSKTLENYMDYNQKTDGSINKKMERKNFYKWQWDAIRKIGSSKKYLEEKK